MRAVPVDINACARSQPRVKIAQWYMYARPPPASSRWSDKLELRVLICMEQSHVDVDDLLIQPLPRRQTSIRSMQFAVTDKKNRT